VVAVAYSLMLPPSRKPVSGAGRSRGKGVVREMRFLCLQVFCFSKAAREFSVTLDSYSIGFLPLRVLAPFCLASFVLCFVLARPSTLADRSPIIAKHIDLQFALLEMIPNQPPSEQDSGPEGDALSRDKTAPSHTEATQPE